MIPWNWQLRLPLGYFGLLMTLNQQARKVVTELSGVIDPDYHREIKLLLTVEVKKSMCVEYRRSLRVTLSSAMPFD